MHILCNIFYSNIYHTHQHITVYFGDEFILPNYLQLASLCSAHLNNFQSHASCGNDENIVTIRTGIRVYNFVAPCM